MCAQQRFEDMECKINELRDQIESVKAEKNLLEIQIAADSEVSFVFGNFFLFVVDVFACPHTHLKLQLASSGARSSRSCFINRKLT